MIPRAPSAYDIRRTHGHYPDPCDEPVRCGWCLGWSTDEPSTREGDPICPRCVVAMAAADAAEGRAP